MATVTDNDNNESDGLLSDLIGQDDSSTAERDSSREDTNNEPGYQNPANTSFSDVKYVNFGSFTYHLRRDDRGETICGISVEDKEFKISSRKPDLLEPCKPCHGQVKRISNDEVCRRLRRSLAEIIDTVTPAESSPGTFSETELISISETIPTDFPHDETSAKSIRYHLSRGIKNIEDSPEDPTNFTKRELEALNDAIKGDGLISTTPEIVLATEDGLMKRTPLSEFQLQRRGGKGVNQIELEGKDSITITSLIYPRDHVFLFTSLGQVYDIRGYKIPSRPPREPGVPTDAFLNLEDGEQVIDLITAQTITEHEYIVTTTLDGCVKRTPTDKFTNIRSTGIKAVDLEETELFGVEWSDGNNHVILTSANGKSIRFEEEQARSMGRTAKGVVGIDLEVGDQLAGMCVIEPEFTGQILTITKNGFGKRTQIDEYQIQNRNGKGLVDIHTSDRNGLVVASGGVTDEQNIIVISDSGRSIRMPTDEISCISRNTKGVNIMELNTGDYVKTITVVETK